MFSHDCPLAVKPASTPRHLVHKNTWRDSLPIDMILSAVSVLAVVQQSSEVPEGLMNYLYSEAMCSRMLCYTIESNNEAVEHCLLVLGFCTLVC